MTDQDTRDRITRLEQRFDLLDKRIDDRSQNLRDAFAEVDRHINQLKDQIRRLRNPQ